MKSVKSVITKVSERGQVSIPSQIRSHYKIVPNMSVAWLETADGIFLLPVSKDPIQAFRGKSKGLTKTLMESRREERDRERSR